MSKLSLPEWELVLSAAARLQRILPDAVLVRGTASALYAGHRFSHDADHTDLRTRFDQVLGEPESAAGWQTARVNRPVQILGSLDGIETGVRQLIRQFRGQPITVPTENEILRIKAMLILKRNATRDYVDFAALADHLGDDATAESLRDFDGLYPQPGGESALQQLQVQLGTPLPFDLEGTDLAEYKNLDARWHDWDSVRKVCMRTAVVLFDRLSGPPT